ncbi:MAG: leucine--tRNA ligase [Novosphingobium sp.]|nr:leucine--tRNA ligase [Novosphingobium sp.]
MSYDFKSIETKWQSIWNSSQNDKDKNKLEGKKFYCLDMFPYPSASGLHVGHWRGYVLSDVYTRIKTLQGYHLLHPMGWDAFGLPAENDAIKKGIHPAINTASNIANFKKQIIEIGSIYNWSKEINTTDPDYYKWTQWIFVKMFKAGLAYEEDMPINWCPSCLTGLANEEVVNNKCDRCSSQVEQKRIRQWVLKITEYAEKLLSGLDKLEWPDKVKTMQKNWIGKSEGIEVQFEVIAPDGTLIDTYVYTTRIETIYGVTFLAIAPDHELLNLAVPSDYKSDVEKYKAEYLANKSLENTNLKSGIFSGTYALHPITSDKIPLYIADYVLKDYATGIVMGVPGHDERDYEFAKKHNIEIKYVIESSNKNSDEQNNKNNQIKNMQAEGILINSDVFNGLESSIIAKENIAEFLIKISKGKRKVNYKLRDWIFSRQRYWGEPIPIIHCPKCGIIPVPEEQLPVTLPEIEKYQPTGTGESPLAAIESWVNTICPNCSSDAKRETNTMPQWAGSSWYFLRYPHLKNKPFDKEELKYWMPVDLYVGGIEHAILHLLYARFYTKFLYDSGYITFDEPFLHLFNQGMVTKYSEKTGRAEKMSKSKGNVVNPDEIVEHYGSDALRLYILFIGPPELDSQWQDTGLEGIKRFLNRFWIFMTTKDLISKDIYYKEDIELIKRINFFIKDFTQRIDAFKPNTAISSFMELLNDLTNNSKFKEVILNRNSAETILVLLSILAPHMACQLLEVLLNKNLQDCQWPTYDSYLLIKEHVTIAIQVNGKLRGTIEVESNAREEQIKEIAYQNITKWLKDKVLIKHIYVPNKLINFIIK